MPCGCWWTGSKTCWQFGCPSSPRSASSLLTRPAVNDEDEDEDRVELTHYFLRLAPWIVRPASPSARAGTMMAAIRTKFEVALKRSRFPKSDWTVVGITAAYLLTAPSQQLADMPPNEAGGCWKELPETLAKKKAIWNPQNEDHRCFMWCVLAHCLGVEGLTWQERQKTVSCSGSFFYPEMTRRRRPVGWQPALADAGVDFSGLPTDRPVNFDDIEAFELRNAGRVEVFVFVWQQTLWTDGLEYYHVLQQRAPSGTGVVRHTVLLLLHSGHYSLIHNFQALASRQGLTLGATPTNTGGCREYKCPRCMARFATKASWQRHRATQCYREIAERTRKVPLPGSEKSLLRYRGKASAELAPLTCYADLEVYSTPAPTVHIAQQQPARQTVAASSCYVAVGRCGYVPPEELRLRLTHQRDSDKYHAVRAMLNDLLKLADHYLTWRRRTRPVSMTRREELEHRAATHCRECLASFETAEKKLHHCHGTGQYLGALCHSCNIAAQTPKTIPVVFHNGGGYDFHFLLRYIATMGSPVSRAPREELGEDSDNDGTESDEEGSESERPMPMVKAAPKPKAAPKGKAKAAPRPLSGWCALQAAIKQGDYSHLCLRVLCKLGEKCLQMSWGPLRFVDSMNVFPTSLASMIDDLRACTHKQLPELFPLMASLHPELQLRTPTDSPPQRRPLKQRRTHCDLEQAWDCILRKLPMPFEHFCGAEAWEMPAVWEQHCYDSVLAGKAVSAEDHRLAVNTANLMGWETFREFHDCYLHTDVLALADVMESYRDSFRAQSGLDPIHYVTLPGAAWDAMLRHSARETPIHLITNEQAYVDVRASVMGGLSCIFQPFAQANNPELGEEDYNSEEPVSWISYLDFNAMYPAAMSLPMPNGPCETVALPEENAARLSWLHDTCLSGLNWESDSEEVSYLLLVDYDFPPEVHDHLDWAPPARMKVGKGLYGPHTADMAERLGLSPSPCEKLVPFLGMHVEEGVDGKRLKFLRDVLGARVWRLHRAYRFACSPFMAGFMELKHSERRQLKTAGSVVAEKVVTPRTPSSAAAA